MNLKYIKIDLSNKQFEREEFKNALFSDTKLENTQFHMCDLSGAIFRNCKKVETASFKRCNLEGTQFDDTKILNHHLNCPSHGSFIGWKATKNAIVKLFVPEDAVRVTPIGAKHCRVSKVKVLQIINKDGHSINETKSKFFDTIYRVGEIVEDKNINIDECQWCERGIGIYITKRQAEEFL